MNLNKAIVAGNVTRGPELRSLPSGVKLVTFSVGTNRAWKDAGGTRQEATDFHNIVVFAKLAELADRYLTKGSQVLVEGRMQTRSWDTPDGQRRYRTEIVADNIQFGAKPESPKEKAATSHVYRSADSQSSNTVNTTASSAQPDQSPSTEVDVKDIPF